MHVVQVSTKTRAIERCRARLQSRYDELLGCREPAILKGLVAGLGPVAASPPPGRRRPTCKSFYQGRRPVAVFVARPESAGPFRLQRPTSRRLDFESDRGLLGEYLDRIAAHARRRTTRRPYLHRLDGRGYYLPGLPRRERPRPATIRCSTRTAAGRRLDRQPHHGARPPRHVAQHRLLPGRSAPLHAVSTGAGREPLSRPARADARRPGREHGRISTRPISSASRDCARRWRPRRLPSWSRATRSSTRRMWWHQVDALEAVQRHGQLLVDHVASVHGHTAEHAAARAAQPARPSGTGEARWRAMFDYYVFGPADRAGAHLPEAARGNLGPMDEMKARRLRAMLLQRLNR